MSVFDVDLLIQDFLTSNLVNKQHYTWQDLSNRCFVEGSTKRILSYKSGGNLLFAVAEHVEMPMGDILRIVLSIPKLPVESTAFRYDCLRMISKLTHTSIVDDISTAGTIIVTVSTKHKGHIDVVFIIKESKESSIIPLLLAY